MATDHQACAWTHLALVKPGRHGAAGDRVFQEVGHGEEQEGAQERGHQRQQRAPEQVLERCMPMMCAREIMEGVACWHGQRACA